jgi:hypothetical protein
MKNKTQSSLENKLQSVFLKNHKQLHLDPNLERNPPQLKSYGGLKIVVNTLVPRDLSAIKKRKNQAIQKLDHIHPNFLEPQNNLQEAVLKMIGVLLQLLLTVVQKMIEVFLFQDQQNHHAHVQKTIGFLLRNHRNLHMVFLKMIGVLLLLPQLLLTVVQEMIEAVPLLLPLFFQDQQNHHALEFKMIGGMTGLLLPLLPLLDQLHPQYQHY